MLGSQLTLGVFAALAVAGVALPGNSQWPGADGDATGVGAHGDGGQGGNNNGGWGDARGDAGQGFGSGMGAEGTDGQGNNHGASHDGGDRDQGRNGGGSGVLLPAVLIAVTKARMPRAAWVLQVDATRTAMMVCPALEVTVAAHGTIKETTLASPGIVEITEATELKEAVQEVPVVVSALVALVLGAKGIKMAMMECTAMEQMLEARGAMVEVTLRGLKMVKIKVVKMASVARLIDQAVAFVLAMTNRKRIHSMWITDPSRHRCQCIQQAVGTSIGRRRCPGCQIHFRFRPSQRTGQHPPHSLRHRHV